VSDWAVHEVQRWNRVQRGRRDMGVYPDVRTLALPINLTWFKKLS
jgi:hypothetical protein